MTGNFTEFKAEQRGTDSWNEQQAMTSTAVCYLTTVDSDKLSMFKRVISKHNINFQLVCRIILLRSKVHLRQVQLLSISL